MRLEKYKQDKTWGLVKKLARVYREPLRLRLVELADTYLTVGYKEVNLSGYGEKDPKKASVNSAQLDSTLF